MSTDVKVPVFPESVAEGEIAAWHKAEGDAIAEGDIIVEIETDKVLLEVPAMVAGVMGKALKDEGDTVVSEEVIGQMAPGEAVAEAPVKQEAAEPATVATDDAVSPAVRRLLAEHNLQAQHISGTGKGGKLTVEDVKQHLANANQSQPAAQQSTEVVQPGARVEERVRMTRLRKTVAARLLKVQHENAILTTFNEVDMQPVMDLRKSYKDVFEKQHGVRLGFMSFFVKAATEALKQLPEVNASIDGDDIVYHGYFDVSIAVSSPRGLVVPVLRNTDQMSMADVEKGIRGFADKAREGTLSIDDMQGGTFTITNGGGFGSMLSTPIINAPQSAILGMHNIVERPVAINGEVVIRPIMYLALSYDHRIIDGAQSVTFLKTIKEYLEQPARMLLQV